MSGTRQGPRPRVIVPRPEQVRTLQGVSFGWIDARLLRDGWLSRLCPEAIAIYVFLVLVADRNGVSFYRRDRIGHALSLGEDDVREGLFRLEALGLVAYSPFGPHQPEGFRQVTALPAEGPPPFPEALASLTRLRSL